MGEQDRRDGHSPGHGDAVGCGQVGRTLEPDDAQQTHHHERPVDLRNVDLSGGVVRRMHHRDPRTVTELHGLAGQRKAAGDQSLRRGDRRQRGNHDHRIQEKPRDQLIERVARRLGAAQEQGALAEVVEHQGREHHAEPGQTNRPAAEVPHVGVQGLATGQDQDHRAEDQEPDHAVANKEVDGVPRIDRREHDRILNDRHDAKEGDRAEPYHHDRRKSFPDPVGSKPLHQEQPEQNDQRHRHDQRLKRRRRHLDPLERAEHRHRRSNDPIPVQQGRPKQRQHDQPAPQPVATPAGPHQRQQGQDPPLAPIVGLEHDRDVLVGHDKHQRPQDQRENPNHILGCGSQSMLRGKTLPQCIQRRGPDIAVDHPQRPECQPNQRLPSRGPVPLVQAGLLGIRHSALGARL